MKENLSPEDLIAKIIKGTATPEEKIQFERLALDPEFNKKYSDAKLEFDLLEHFVETRTRNQIDLMYQSTEKLNKKRLKKYWLLIISVGMVVLTGILIINKKAHRIVPAMEVKSIPMTDSVLTQDSLKEQKAKKIEMGVDTLFPVVQTPSSKENYADLAIQFYELPPEEGELRSSSQSIDNNFRFWSMLRQKKFKPALSLIDSLKGSMDPARWNHARGHLAMNTGEFALASQCFSVIPKDHILADEAGWLLILSKLSNKAKNQQKEAFVLLDQLIKDKSHAYFDMASALARKIPR